MKKIVAVMLSVMLLCTSIAPTVFADGAVSSVKYPAAFDDDSFNGATIDKATTGMYGKSEDEQSRMVKFSGLSSKPSDIAKANLAFEPQAGSKVKISTQFALDGSYTGSHLAMGILVDPDSDNDDYVTNDTRTFIIPYSGSVTSESGKSNAAVPASDSRKSYPVSTKTWVTYDMVYNIVDKDGTKYIDTYSVYVDGQPVFEGCKFLIGSSKDKTVSADKVYGIYHGERGCKKDVHYANMSVTYYPPSCTEAPITTNPWTASGLGTYFSVNTDHSLLLKNPSLTDAQISNAAPEGWTFSRVSYDDPTDGKLEYIKMVNNTTGASYYKRFVSQDYVTIKNVNFTGATTSNANAVWGTANGMRYVGVTSKGGENGLASEVIKTNPKTADNDYIKLSYTSIPDKLCGLAMSTPVGSSYPYINGALSGRIAYEWSFMVDECAESAIACRLYFNGKEGTNAIGGDYKTWIPFHVLTSGAILFDAKAAVVPTGKAQTVLPGEWHHFVIIADTNADKAEIYQNGVLIGTRQFTEDTYLLNSVNGIEAGINNTGLPTVNVAHSINFDDFRMGYVSEDWKPETASVASVAQGAVANNDISVIIGTLASASDVTLSEGATAVLSDGTLKVTDESGLVVRYYKVSVEEFSLIGFNLDGLTTDAGPKTKTITIENNKAEPYSAVFILASYSSDGALVSVDVSPDATVYSKQTKELTATINVTADEPVAKFKAFLWENTDSAYPLFENLGK